MRAYMVGGSQQAPKVSDDTPVAARLDQAHAAKLVGMLRCRHHYFSAKRGGSVHAVDMFFAHANLDQSHADAIADRIVQLGGRPTFSPAAIAEATSIPFQEDAGDVAHMAESDLYATRSVNALISEMLRFVDGEDARTRKLLQRILDDDRARTRNLATLARAS